MHIRFAVAQKKITVIAENPKYADALNWKSSVMLSVKKSTPCISAIKVHINGV